MNTKADKAKKFLKKMQNLSEGQKLILAVLGTIALIFIIFVTVGFLNSLIISK